MTLIRQKKPMEIVRKYGPYQLVKMGRQLFAFRYDADKDQVQAILNSDRFAGELRSAPGLSNASVYAVAEGRKRATALAYFNEFIRGRRRDGEELPARSEIKAEAGRPRERTEEASPKICGWCNGSGQDPRNIEWRCNQC